jgi:hypothetical protein
MVLAFAGRRAQSIKGDIDAVALRVRCLVRELHPSAVVGAMADGADLMVVEAALAMPDGPEVHVILPTPPEVFREQSVEAGWRRRFDHALNQIRERGTLRSLALEDGSEAYLRANAAFLDRATELATDGQCAVALVIAAVGEGQIVEGLVASAHRRGLPVLRVDPH